MMRLASRAGSSGGVGGAIEILPASKGGLAAGGRAGIGGERRVTDGARTRDVQDHNLALYQLSYGYRAEGGLY